MESGKSEVLARLLINVIYAQYTNKRCLGTKNDYRQLKFSWKGFAQTSYTPYQKCPELISRDTAITQIANPLSEFWPSFLYFEQLSIALLTKRL